jgi:tetratricopeptide (TPR) repeat protein
MGVVYLCSQPGLDRPVAVKVMIAGRHATPDQILRFQREARAAAQLTHPNVLQIYDWGSEGPLNYFVMEYVDGWSLDQLIGTSILGQDRALYLIAQIARALHAAHTQGIIHRDIKPSNIMINREGQPKLADFGLAKRFHDTQDLSGSGDIIGTPRYMSPEQALAVPGEVDHRADIYSLGAILYEMLAGCPPVDGPNALAILRQLIDEEPVPLRARNPAVSEELAALCERAIARDRNARFATAAEFAEAIEDYLRAHPGRDGTTGWDDPLASVPQPEKPAVAGSHRPGIRRRRALLAAGAATVLGTLGFALAARSRLGSGPGPELAAEAPAVEVGETSIPLSRGPSHTTVSVPARTTAPRASPPGPSIDPGITTLAVARQFLQPGGSHGLTRAAAPRDRLKSLIDDLTSVVKSAPGNIEVLYLRGCAYRRAGEPSAALLDLNQVLRRDPRHRDARTERLLANYQLHVLYFGNLNERALRPIRVEALVEDLRVTLKEDDPAQKYLARLIEALARQDDEQAGRLAEAGPPPGVQSEDRADFQMVEADALFHSAEAVHRAEEAAGGATETDKEKLKLRLQKLGRDAVTALTQGLNADPSHVGLLFLKADSVRRLAAWDPSEEDSQITARRQRLAFDTALDQLRQTALMGGCDHAIARAVLLTNNGRESQALDRVKDALSCQTAVPFLHTFKAWLRLQSPPDGLLTVEDIDRILNDLQVAVDRSDDFNPYFVRALLQAAAGRWEEARSDLRACRRQLRKQSSKETLPTNIEAFKEWLVQASTAPLTKYAYATSDVLTYLPVAEDQKIRLAEIALRRLDDPKLAQEEGLADEDRRGMKGWIHQRLATSFAAKNDRQGVLQHVRAALELRRPDLIPKTFRDDAALGAWNADPEFEKLYREFDKPAAGPTAAPGGSPEKG